MATEPEKPIEGAFVEHDLAVIPPKEIALSTQDPAEFLQRAVKQADALKSVIDAKKLAVYIGGGTKAHVLIDGWQALMALNGVMPYTVSCVKERDEQSKLTVHVVTEIRRVSDGTVLTRVETECSQHERRWEKAEDYAVISMAQTRGVGKGCRQLFGWVMTLAGYNATPAEEVPEEQVPAQPRQPRPSQPPTVTAPSAAAPISAAAAPKTGYIDTAPTNDRDLRSEVIKLWNDHPKEAVAFIRSNNLPSGVASMTREEVMQVRDHLAGLAA